MPHQIERPCGRPEKEPDRKLSGEIVWLSRFFQGKYKPYELFGGMRDCDVIVLALGAFLGKIGRKGFIPMADKLSGVENGVS